jgi:FlaA1/EpsC-like NDP-sugar epimerase
MVTGAAGSIGSEICRQIAPFHLLAIVGFDQAETHVLIYKASKGLPSVQ